MLTICMSVYGQPKMLAKQLEVFSTYPDSVVERLKVIVVDDCGDPPVDPGWCDEMASRVRVRSLKVFRVMEDIPWNQPGGRNLAMHHAEGWCLMIDPDMAFSAKMMQRFLEAASKMQRSHLIRYGLKHVNDPKRDVDMSSPNTYLIHREDFWRVGGYDEDYAGAKGWSDVQLLDILNAHFKISKRRDLFADFYSTNQIEDAAVTKLDRSTGANRKKRLKKHAKAKAVGGWRKWVSSQTHQPMRFQWGQVYPTP